MKYSAVFAVLLVVVAVTSAQRYPRYPLPVVRLPLLRNPPVIPRGDRYAASLGGAQVGTYGKVKTSGRRGNGLPYNADEVYGESLGNAKVGIYGNDRTVRRRPLRG